MRLSSISIDDADYTWDEFAIHLSKMDESERDAYLDTFTDEEREEMVEILNALDQRRRCARLN